MEQVQTQKPEQTVSYKNGTELIIKTIYGDCFNLPHSCRSLHAKIERGTEDGIEEILETIENIQYNLFDGERVAQVMRRLIDDGVIGSVAFGREFSPALYIGLPTWSDHIVGNDAGEDNYHLSKDEWVDITDLIIREIKTLHPSEVHLSDTIRGDVLDIEDVTVDGLKDGQKPKRYIRIWWD